MTEFLITQMMMMTTMGYQVNKISMYQDCLTFFLADLDDLDDDGNGIPDLEERDTDGDGIPGN